MNHFPQSVRRRILERAARGEKRVVVVMKNGKPSSVWGFTEYLDRKELAKKVKPWEKRKSGVRGPDPLGAVDAAPPELAALTRESMYEDDEE